MSGLRSEGRAPASWPVHHPVPWPGSVRLPTPLPCVGNKDMDGQVRPGHDTGRGSVRPDDTGDGTA